MNDIQSKITNLTGKLMDDYGKGRVIDEIKMFAYPDKDIIIDILEKLKIVIYPGYHRNSNYRTYTVKNNISILLEDIIYNLIKQTTIVLKYAPEYQNADDEMIAKESERITFDFLDKIPKIREYIETDIQAFYSQRKMTATLPPITRTRSSAPTPDCTRFSPRASLTSCFCSACR